MVLDKEKWLATHLHLEAKRLVEAVSTFDPTTAKGREAKHNAILSLKDACKHLETLCRHYSAIHYRNPPPKESDHDLP